MVSTTGLIHTFTGPTMESPGRVFSDLQSATRRVIQTEPTRWEIQVTSFTEDSYRVRTMADWLDGGGTVEVDLVDLQLPTIGTAYPVTASSLGDSYLELRLASDAVVELGDFAMYNNRLVKVVRTSVGVTQDRIFVRPRPDALPPQASLFPVTVVNAVSPGTTGPISFRYPNWTKTSLTLRVV